MAQTKLANLVNPQVMADMVSARLPKKIKFAPIARIDTTLAGRPGNTITVPKYAYIGDAEDVAEGVAMGTTVLSASTTSATIKKAGKAVEITDESVLSGMGDPLGQGVNQLTMSIAAKIDNDGYAALLGASLTYDGSGAVIGYSAIVDADAVFDDESDGATAKILFINPQQEATLRKDSDFKDKNKYPLDVIMNGTIGSIAGAQVVKSKKVAKIEYTKSTSGTASVKEVVASGATSGQVNLADVSKGNVWDATNKAIYQPAAGDFVLAVANAYYLCPLVVVDVKDPNEAASADGVSEDESALTIYMKRNAMVETDRDILKKTTVASADEHYTVVLSNESKAVLAKFKA